VLHLSLSRNHRHYSAEIEYSVIDLEHKLDAVLTINNVEYKATLRASDRDIKSVIIEVFADKHYFLDAQVVTEKLFKWETFEHYSFFG
jgi:hypothetical protein